ncbi:unnamed protein product, partial [marine sediment metagenome]
TPDSGEFIGYDVHTGQVRGQFLPDTDIFFMHQRCYRSKATDRYLIPSRTGTEFIDPNTGHWDINHWVRGGCIYGVMPCNGLLYATPHSCACYMEAKLYGFNALAPASSARRIPKRIADDQRLERGPAYPSLASGEGPGEGNPDQTVGPHLAASSPSSSEGGGDDWPTYRGNAARSGFTAASLPATIRRAWQTKLGGRLSPVTIAGGTLFVASIDTHTVHALDAGSGKKLWAYTAGGRVDSPPTVW